MVVGRADAKIGLSHATIRQVVTESVAAELARDLDDLAIALDALGPPPDPEVGGAVDRRDRVIRTIRSYLIPRATDPTSPLLVVFAGPTGAGKSTLLNSILGAARTPAGPLRPTTDAPVVLTTPERVSGYQVIDGVTCVVVPGRARILDELTLIDTPDIDSTSRDHRALAELMVDNADVVVHVTSVSRYADLVPWEVLRRAHSRGTSVIHVLNRVTRASGGAISDYGRRLDAEGLRSEVVVVHEQHMRRGAQLIPGAAIQELRDRLIGVVTARNEDRLQTFRSVLRTAMEEAADVLATVEDDNSGWSSRSDHARDAFKPALGRIAERMVVEPLDSLGLSSLAALSDRRFLVSMRARRRLPSPTSIEKNAFIFRSAISVAVSSDLRRSLDGFSDLSRDEKTALLEEARRAVSAGIDTWWSELGSLDHVRTSISSGLSALLVARASVAAEERSAIGGILGVLGERTASTPPIPDVRSSLLSHLTPVYAGIEYRVLAQLTSGIASLAEINRARLTMSTVIARSSFANA